MFATIKRLERSARCRRCREALVSGSWIASSWIYIDASTEETKEIAYHIECAIDVDPVGVQCGLEEAALPDDPSLTALVQRAQRRSLAVSALEEQRAKAARGERFEPVVIEPAVDRRGRPRVRVRFGGSLSSGNAWATIFEEHAPDWTVASSRREYVLAPSATSAATHRDDPSQPVVAALFGAPMTVKIVTKQREKVQAWRTEGLPTPLLWVVGEESRDRAALDKKVLELRALIASVGYEADEAIVVVSERLDARAFESLSVALDEQLDRHAITTAGEQSAARRALAMLDDAIEAERTEAWPSALERALAAMDPRDEDAASAIVASACRCASDAASHSKLVAILQKSKGATDATQQAAQAVLRAAIHAPGRVMPALFDEACALLARPVRGAVSERAWLQIIEDAIAHSKPKTQRSKALAAALTTHGDERCARRLSARAAGETTALALTFAQIAAQIEARGAEQENDGRI